MAYNKKTWVSDEVITKEALNNIEDGIAAVEKSIPTRTSQLINDSNFITEKLDLSNYATLNDIHDHNNKDILDQLSPVRMQLWDSALQQSDLNDYVTKDEVSDFINKDEMTNFVTKEEISDFVSKEEASDFVSKDDISNFASKDDISNFASKDDISNFVNKDENEQMLERIYNYSNNFITDYKGLCVRTWEEGSLYTKRFREDLLAFVNKAGINSISLVINTYQQTQTSNNPFNRVPVNLEEIEDYIKFLKDNNLRIFFKHHVECDDTSYVWRASFDPENADEWFSIYNTNVIEYAKLCERYKVEAFSIGSEYRELTSKYPDKWKELIKELRKVYTGLLTYGANLNNDERDEVHYINFWNLLDFIGIDFYIYPIEQGSVDDYKKAFYHTGNHKNVHLMLDSISNKYNKPIVFCEYGKTGDDDNKNNYLQAINESFFVKENISGGFIWVYDPAISDWVETNDTSISIVNSNNLIKGILKNDSYYTTIKDQTKSGFSKFLEFNVDAAYKDAHISFDFYVKGRTNVALQDHAKVMIKISTHDTLTPNVFYEVDGDMPETDFIYTVTDNKLEFYVNVPQYCSVIYKPESSEIGQFEIFEYQELLSMSGTSASNKTVATLLRIKFFMMLCVLLDAHTVLTESQVDLQVVINVNFGSKLRIFLNKTKNSPANSCRRTLFIIYSSYFAVGNHYSTHYIEIHFTRIAPAVRMSYFNFARASLMRRIASTIFSSLVA